MSWKSGFIYFQCCVLTMEKYYATCRHDVQVTLDNTHTSIAFGHRHTYFKTCANKMKVIYIQVGEEIFYSYFFYSPSTVQMFKLLSCILISQSSHFHSVEAILFQLKQKNTKNFIHTLKLTFH